MASPTSKIESPEVPIHHKIPSKKNRFTVPLKKTKKRIRKRSEKSCENRFLIRRKNDSLIVETSELLNLIATEKPEKIERAYSNLRNSDFETQESLNEGSKIIAKIIKIKNYWAGTSQLIPNTFRITCFLDDDLQHLLEYQDLSRKEVLAQYNSKQSGSFDFDNSSEVKELRVSSGKETINGKKVKLLSKPLSK